MKEILLFAMEHWFITLDLICGLLWLLIRLSPGGHILRNWEDMRDYDKSSFGTWTPFVGILFGYVSFGLWLVLTLIDVVKSSPSKSGR